MATLPQPRTIRKAFRATLRDEAGAVSKIDEVIYFFNDVTGAISPIEVEDCAWLCVLGEIGVADTQALMDRLHGGAVGICLSRRQEVA
jgi:hypothetical protein